MAIYDFFLSRNGAAATPETYVGHAGRLFYDSATGEIRISDGVTPGGNPIPITIATTTQAGAVKPGQGFTISPTGLLGLNAGPSFYLDEEDVFRLRPGSADLIGGIKAGPGIVIDSEGTLTIDLTEVEDFSFGDFTATVGEYTDLTEYALLGVVNANEDVVIASNGTGTVCIVGELHLHRTNGTVTGSLEDGPVFQILSDGQIKAYITAVDGNEGALEIIGSSTGVIIPPGQPGTMLHLTGQPDEQCRFYIDGNGNYASIVGRRWNGSVASPTQVLAAQDVLRINATAATDAGVGNVAMAQISFTALENQTTTSEGSSITLTVTPVGSAASARVDALVVKATGIELPTAGSTVKLSGSSSGTITVQAAAAAGTNTITLPATTGTVVTTGDTGSVTNTMLAGSIANAKLANSTISGIALGSNLAALSTGNYLTGTDYNGGTARTFAVDATTTATASKVVARDANATVAGANFQGTVRNIGTVAAGGGDEITINFATDHIVRCDFSSETIEVGFSNYTAGRTVTLIATNTNGFANRVLDIGISGTNAQGDATPDINNGTTAIVTYYCTGTTVDDVFASVVFNPN